MQYKKSAVPNDGHLCKTGNETGLRVLFVDSSPDRAQLTLRAMKQYAPGFDGEVVAGIRSAGLLASATHYDCAVVHQRLMDGAHSSLDELRNAHDHSSLPVVVIADRTDCADAVYALRAGAADFLAERTLTPERLLAALQLVVQRSILDATVAQERLDLHHEKLMLSRKQELMAETQEQLAHTLLTPLAAVSEYISMVLDGVGDSFSNDQERFLAVARGRCSELQSAIESMVALSQLQPDSAPNTQSVCLDAVVGEVLDQFSLQAALKGIHFGCAIDRDVHYVQADEYELQGILIELVTQMIRACSSSGSILVFAEKDAEQADHIKLMLRAQVGGGPGFLEAANDVGVEETKLSSRYLSGGLLLETRVDNDLQFEFSLPVSLAPA